MVNKKPKKAIIADKKVIKSPSLKKTKPVKLIPLMAVLEASLYVVLSGIEIPEGFETEDYISKYMSKYVKKAYPNEKRQNIIKGYIKHLVVYYIKVLKK